MPTEPEVGISPRNNILLFYKDQPVDPFSKNKLTFCLPPKPLNFILWRVAQTFSCLTHFNLHFPNTPISYLHVMSEEN